jgi:hypothetical protein
MGLKRNLDLQENERDEPGQKRIKVGVKDCRKCGESKSLDQYNVDRIAVDGLQSYCKACQRASTKARRETQAGFIMQLVSRAKNNTQDRNKKDRDHKFTLTVPKLNKLITDQNGKCAISGAVLVFKQFSDNQASVDRINDNLGYVDGNCRLVCLEFNTSVKWSRKLLLKSIALSGIPPDNFEDETSDLESVLSKANEKGTVYRKWKVLTKRGIETVFCHHCSETKPRKHFYKAISLGCRACCVRKVQQTQSTWRGALQVLVCSAKKNTKGRNNVRKKEDQTECTLTYLELVAILKAQGGMCAYSRVALSPRSGDWKASLERKDVRLGYSSSNVCLVCQRFNGTDSTALAKGAVEGSGGWSREKLLRYAALVT